MARRKNITLTPEQQKFAEAHYGLLLKFMSRYSLGDEEYGLFAERYLRTVVTYMQEESLHRYAFSTVLWYRLWAELGRERRRKWRRQIELPMDDMAVPPSVSDDSGDEILWDEIVRRVTDNQQKILWLKFLGYSNQEISAMQSCARGTVGKEIRRAKKSLKKAGII